MPDQNINSSGSREVDLQELKAAGRRSTSLRDECREFNRLSSTVCFSKSCDVKPSLRADGVSLDALLSAAPNQPSSGKQVPAVPATCDSAVKASITSPKIAARLGRPLKTVGVAASDVVKSLETEGEARLDRKRKAQSPPSEAPEPENVEIGSNNPPEYRGVRVRPGVKGFLVEIRPKRWKRTIWLGTYSTSPEAARAFDAGIFYTGKNIPYNFKESEGSFPPLPEHLCLDNFDPDVMEQSKIFVKQWAMEAARRSKVRTPALPLTRKKDDDETTSGGVQGYNFTSGSDSESKGEYVKHKDCDGFRSGSTSENKGEYVKDEDCDGFSSGSASENEYGHVKDEEHDDLDLVTPNPFQNLEPLPYDFPHCDKQLLVNDKDCWGRISVTVDDYTPQSAMLGDEDIDITQQTPSPIDELLFDLWHNEEELVAAETSFKSICGSKSDGNLSSWGLDFWGLQSHDLGAGLSLFNVEECDLYACPQARKLSGLSFTQPEDALVLCQNWEGAGLKYGCLDPNYFSVEAMMMNSQFCFDMPIVGDDMVG